jgi:WD40 repeat protein
LLALIDYSHFYSKESSLYIILSNMKVETPQILWNSEGDKGRNAPLYSIAMLESGIAMRNDRTSSSSSHHNNKYGNVLATAGNTNAINLWRVCFDDTAGTGTGSSQLPTNTTTIFQKQTKQQQQQPLHKIDYMTSLTRHELPVNTVAFSPDGLHLVTAGEAGNIVLWSVPVNKRGGGNGRHFWSTISKENELTVRIISTHCEGVCDISWSADSKRFVVGTIDASVLVFEDKHFQANHSSPDTHQKESEWQVVFRNSSDHTQFVQGTAYDPLGVYVATMGSDRTVRVFPRKTPPKSKKQVLRPTNAKGAVVSVSPPPEHQRMVEQLLTDSKLELGKSKQLKHRRITIDDTGAQIKHKLYADEFTCESFFRRLSWTTDGAFLITPSALWHTGMDHCKKGDNSESTTTTTTSTTGGAPPSFSTFLFARHRFDQPYKVLSGLEKVKNIGWLIGWLTKNSSLTP